MFGRKDLSVRADRATLAPSSEAGWADVLQAEGETDAWRIVELSSAHGRPFDVELRWSSANGSGSIAHVTVARAARVCMFARTVVVRVKNLAALPNAVGVTIADGYAETRNQLEVRGDAQGEGPVAIRVPAFARTVWFEVADPEDREALIWTVDGEGKARGVTRLGEQPDNGVPVGGAGELWFWPARPQAFRAVFHLNV